PSASRVLGAFIDSQQHRVRPVGRAAHKPALETRGRFFDLREIYDDLNARYFGGSIDARITWGQKCGKPRRRNSIKMGSYSVEEKLIRVHRSLDRAFVPRYFVEWIVFHEMLHQVHKATVVNGRRMFHTPAFPAVAAGFEHYERARAGERAHLDGILPYGARAPRAGRAGLTWPRGPALCRRVRRRGGALARGSVASSVFAVGE